MACPALVAEPSVYGSRVEVRGDLRASRTTWSVEMAEGLYGGASVFPPAGTQIPLHTATALKW